MAYWRGRSGKLISPEDATDIVVFRHVYKMNRQEISLLPQWEKELLAVSGRSIMGLNADNYGNRELSDSEVQNIILSKG